MIFGYIVYIAKYDDYVVKKWNDGLLVNCISLNTSGVNHCKAKVQLVKTWNCAITHAEMKTSVTEPYTYHLSVSFLLQK